jgi:hypothetical protein
MSSKLYMYIIYLRRKGYLFNFTKFVGTNAMQQDFYNFFQWLFQKIHVVINWAGPKSLRRQIYKSSNCLFLNPVCIYYVWCTVYSDYFLNKYCLNWNPWELTWYFLFYRPSNFGFKMHYPKPRNQYWVADHYKIGHVPQKTTILK